MLNPSQCFLLKNRLHSLIGINICPWWWYQCWLWSWRWWGLQWWQDYYDPRKCLCHSETFDKGISNGAEWWVFRDFLQHCSCILLWRVFVNLLYLYLWLWQVLGGQWYARLQLPFLKLPWDHSRTQLHKETSTNQPSGNIHQHFTRKPNHPIQTSYRSAKAIFP